MSKVMINLDMDEGEIMIASELIEFLQKVPSNAVIQGMRYASYSSGTNEVEIG